MERRWDIIILPNTSEGGMNLSVGARSLKLGALFAVVILATVFVIGAVKLDSWKYRHTSRLAALSDEIGERKSDLKAIDNQFQDLLTVESKLRTIAGLKPRDIFIDDSGTGGMGGPEKRESLGNGLQAGGQISFDAGQDTPRRPLFQAENTTLETRLKAMAAAHDGLIQILEAFEKEQDRLLKIPSINPVYSPDAWVSSGYGYRRDPINGKRKFHDGLDIVAPRRTPIIAPADGTVIFAGWRAGLGRAVEIKHGYGYTTLYAHNDKLMVKKGEKVKRGDTLSLLGNSGRSTGPHLHYEVQQNGKTRNPHKYVID